MAIAPITAVSGAVTSLVPEHGLARPEAGGPGGPGFSQILAQGLDALDTKVAKADALVKAYALGETIPVHQVTIALEEARFAVELAVQVRERLTETYRSFMNMQL